MTKKTHADEMTRDLPPLSFRAALRPESVDPEKRTAEVVWTTGARVLLSPWFSEKFWEELSLNPKHVRMGRLNNGAPLMHLASMPSSVTHAGATVVGVVESARLEKERGVATVRFPKAEDDPEADKVFRKVKDGILQNVSVGYRIHKMQKVEDGEDGYPVMRAIDWEPHEITIVPMGADDGAGFRGTADRAVNPCVFVAHQERAMDPKQPELPATTSPAPAADSTQALVAQARAENQRATAEAEKLARETADRAVDAERTRISEIRKICARTKLGEALAQRLIDAKTSIDEARKVAFDDLVEGQPDIDGHGVRFDAGEDAREKFVRAGASAIIERAGLLDMVVRAKADVPRLARYFRDLVTDPGELAGMRVIDLARTSLERRGVSVRGLFGESLIRRALEYRADAGMNVTGDFAVLLETAMNKVFLGAYALADVTWPRWAGRKSVQDFRTSTFYRPGTFGVLDTVTEAGEIKHKNIPDGTKRTLTPATKGNIIGLSRRAMANDDLGAFRELGAGLGQAAALSVETDAFAMIIANSGLGIAYGDGSNVFAAGHNNIGPTGVMSVITLDGARAVMAKQKDPSGNQYLAMRPAVWLGPVELGGQARQINRSTSDPTASINAGVANRVLDIVRDVVDSPFLSAQSAARHYLLADPGVNPAFAVGFLDGQEAPRIESEQLFGFDGLQMRIILDYGTAVLDYRSAVTCAGA